MGLVSAVVSMIAGCRTVETKTSNYKQLYITHFDWLPNTWYCNYTILSAAGIYTVSKFEWLSISPGRFFYPWL